MTKIKTAKEIDDSNLIKDKWKNYPSEISPIFSLYLDNYCFLDTNYLNHLRIRHSHS